MRTLIVLAAAAMAASGCSEVATHAQETTAPRPVRVVAAQRIAPVGGVRYSVSIQPRAQVSLAFKAAGYVSDIQQRKGADGRGRALQPGDVVPAGSVLARVREADYRENLDQATGALQEGDASYVKAELDLERARYLFEAEALTRPDLDAAQAAYDAAAARTAAARARVRLAEISLRDTLLTAPITGVVLERVIEAGSLVGVGTPAFVLGDVSSVKALFGVPDSLVHRITPGQALAVTTDALPGDAFTGRVTAIAPAADPVSRVFGIEVTIPNQDGRLKPGMIGTVAVQADLPQAQPGGDTLTISLSAVVRPPEANGSYAVFVAAAESGRAVARLRPVTLGDVHGNAVIVTSGVGASDRVVVMGATLLRDSEPIRIIP